MASFRFALVVAAMVVLFVGEIASNDECELHKPTIQDFCCDIYEEELEFMDCLSEWTDHLDFPKNQREEMVMNFCIAECTYNETDYLKNETALDLRVIRSHLYSKLDEGDDVKLMYAAFKKCDKHGRDMLKSEEVQSLKKRLAKAGCRPYAGLVMECVTNELILNCPEDKWHDSSQCEHGREFLQNCMKK